MEKNEISLDLWGGSHILNKDSLEYTIIRDCGLFSNLTVSMYGIMKYYSLGFTPKKLSLFLNEYKFNHDFYPDLFKLTNFDLNFDDIGSDELYNFYRFCEPNPLGLGRRKSEVNFNILNRILHKFFNLSDECYKIYNSIIKDNNIDFSNTVFVWARKTDKIYETNLPNAEKYKSILVENNLLNKDIILQTDDISVLEEFNKLNIKFRTLNEIPYSESNEGFHVKMSIKYDDDVFERRYNMSKTIYLQKLLSLSKIASMCEYSVVYPGCLTTFIPILKNGFTNQFSFNTNNTLMS